MIKNYVLIDYENVQPKNLEMLKGNNFKILVFVGANQNKIPFEVAEVLQSFGNEAEYIKIDSINKNNLDFHIAFYIGKISSIDENAYFHIISKDTGFDPLINHLKTKKIRIQRESDLSEIPLIKISNKKEDFDKISFILDKLKEREKAKPTTKKALFNSINSWLQRTLDDKNIDELISDLAKKKYITLKDNKVNYNF